VYDFGPKRLGEFPTALGTMTRLAYERAQAARLDLEPLLKKARLTKQQVEDVLARISANSQIVFLDLVASALQDEHLGFHVCQAAELRRFGLLYYVAASSDTLGEALRRLARYISVVNESVSVKYLEGKDIRIVTNYVGIARHLDRHQIEGFATLLIRICRGLTGHFVKPSRVRFTHPRVDKFYELGAFLGCDVKFGAAVDEVAFAPPIADIPVVGADPYLNQLLITQFEEELSHWRKKRGSFRAVVENAIAPLLPHGNARESEIARRCGLSRRTLMRRLTSESLTFSEVLHDLRRDMAALYLADHSLSISQIAWLLGYQGVSGFTSAFKQWTGKTPREARFQLQHP
jgi:AraC-like DNA-binding protein